jgi:hypothetical protein
MFRGLTILGCSSRTGFKVSLGSGAAATDGQFDLQSAPRQGAAVTLASDPERWPSVDGRDGQPARNPYF